MMVDVILGEAETAIEMMKFILCILLMTVKSCTCKIPQTHVKGNIFLYTHDDFSMPNFEISIFRHLVGDFFYGRYMCKEG